MGAAMGSTRLPGGRPRQGGRWLRTGVEQLGSLGQRRPARHRQPADAGPDIGRGRNRGRWGGLLPVAGPRARCAAVARPSRARAHLRGHRWRCRRRAPGGSRMQWFLDTPRLTVDCVDWVAAHDLAAVCTDTVSPDGIQPARDFGRFETSQPFHVGAIVGLGLTIGELFDLEDLAAHCADRGRWIFLLSMSPRRFPRRRGFAGQPGRGHVMTVPVILVVPSRRPDAARRRGRAGTGGTRPPRG